MIQIDLIAVLSLAGIWISITLAALAYVKANRRREYDENKNRAQLEMFRDSYELKIYELMERMAKTEDRWKDVNHLLLTAQRNELSPFEAHKSTLTQFLKAHGVREEDTKIRSESVFVLTPFHKKYEETFQAISETCHRVGLKVFRGDESHIKGDILPHILKQLCRARLVIANIDGRNPNVFYELGIAHAIDKGTILVSQNVSEVPFDIKSNRLIIYKTKQDLKDQLKEALTRALVSEGA